MNAGRMDTLVTLERQVDGGDVDGYGVSDPNWSGIGEEWAQVVPTSGTEGMLADQTESTLTHRVTLWGNPLTRGLTPKDRVSYFGDDGMNHVLQIRSVSKPQRSALVELLCEELVK